MPKIVDKRERALQLVQAATKVVARKGFAATRMEDVAKEAGVSKGLVYEYYRSKEDLFFRVCDHLYAQRRLKANGDEAYDSPAAALIEQVASNYDLSPDFFLVMVDYWGKILKANPRQRRKYVAHVDTFYADRRQEIIDFIASYLSSGDFQLNLDSTVLANLIVACIEGINMQEFLCSGGARKKEVLAMLSELILSATQPGRDQGKHRPSRSELGNRTDLQK